MKSSKFFPAALIISAILISSCTSLSMDRPSGFADMQLSNGRYRMISPEGFRMELYSEANQPRQDLSFWSQAYDSYMQRSGYIMYEEPSMLDAAAGPLYFSTWLVPYGGETYLYAHGITVIDEEIVIIEMAGPLEVYEDNKQQIRTSIQSLKQDSFP